MGYWPALLGTALNLTVSVWAQFGGSKQSEVQVTSSALKVQGDEEDNDKDWGDVIVDANIKESSVTRTVHFVWLLGFWQLADFFHNPISFDCSPYLWVSFDTIIALRLALLNQENM